MLKNNIITHTSPKSPVSEALRTLRTNVEFTSIDRELKVILVTSALMNEGKSWVSANLGVVFAQQGKRVLLIDADMRKGTQHKIFGLENKQGLSNCLADSKKEVEGYIRKTDVDNLYVMPCGNVPPNPSELLSSKRMNDFLNEMKAKYDIVILDGPPSTVVTDGLILTRIADTTLIIATYKQTTIDDLNNVKKAIENVGGKIGGVVLNKVDTTKKGGYYYKYYSYYSQDGVEGNVVKKKKKKSN